VQQLKPTTPTVVLDMIDGTVLSDRRQSVPVLNTVLVCGIASV
jgi:hypothetical protein